MGIFEAEVRRHTGEEDMLTSRVFGTFDILDRSKFLAPFLEQCGVSMEGGIDPTRFTFSYWEGTGRRTPDIILRDKSILISIESKVGSAANTAQLVEEYEDGVKLHKNFWLIAVTAHYVEPYQVEEAKKALMKKGQQEPRVQWCNWQQIYSFLRRNANNGNETEQKLIGDLLSLLKAKGLSMFDRFNEAQLNSVAQLWPEMLQFLEECSALLGTLSSHLHQKNITCIEKGYTNEIVQTGWRASKLQDSAFWLPRGMAMNAWDNAWEEKGWRQCLTMHFRLRPFELIVGYQLGISGQNAKVWQMFSEMAKSCVLAEKLHTIGNCSVSYYGRGYVLLDRVRENSLNKEAFSSEALPNAIVIIIGRAFNHHEMASPKLMDDIVDCLVQIRDVVNENGLYFSKQVIQSFTPHDTEEEMEGLPIEGQPDEQESEED